MAYCLGASRCGEIGTFGFIIDHVYKICTVIMIRLYFAGLDFRLEFSILISSKGWERGFNDCFQCRLLAFFQLSLKNILYFFHT